MVESCVQNKSYDVLWNSYNELDYDLESSINHGRTSRTLKSKNPTSEMDQKQGEHALHIHKHHFGVHSFLCNVGFGSYQASVENGNLNDAKCKMKHKWSIKHNYDKTTENKWKPSNENEEQTLGSKENAVGKINGT